MLISIIVITYNSEKYIKETLESVLHQTYAEIEVILSDDFSTDSTPHILKQFEETYKNATQKRIVFTQTSQNLGIVGNYNHALKLARGEWIKYIAGDDILKPNCIECFVNNIEVGDYFLCCGREKFTNDSNERCITFEKQLFAKSVKEEIKNILKDPWIVACGATIFLKKDKLLQMGGFNTNYPMVEDFPLGMTYLCNNIFIKQINEILIEYRVHHSVSNSNNPIFNASLKKAQHYYCPKLALKNRMYIYWLHFKIENFIEDYSSQNLGYKILGYFIRVFDLINYQQKYRNKLKN